MAARGGASAPKVKVETLIIGDGGAALFAAVRAINEGHTVAIVNPFPGFGVGDLRPRDGLCLWNAAFRASSLTVSLPNLWDELGARLREALPVSLGQAALKRVEQWSLFSSVPVHRLNTAEKEQEYFRLERKPWSAGMVRLVNPEFVEMKFKPLGLRLNRVASVEGAMVRGSAVLWDPLAMGRALSEFLAQKEREGRCHVFTGCSVKNRVGRRLKFSRPGAEPVVEYTGRCLIPLTGDLLPFLRPMLRMEDEEGWIQGLRKRRREQQFAWFQCDGGPQGGDPLWFDLGEVSYLKRGPQMEACWRTTTGPDGLDTVVDEGIRLGARRFQRNLRGFSLEWEWKTPQWRTTPYDTHWATAFEGDIWAHMELLGAAPL